MQKKVLTIGEVRKARMEHHLRLHDQPVQMLTDELHEMHLVVGDGAVDPSVPEGEDCQLVATAGGPTGAYWKVVPNP